MKDYTFFPVICVLLYCTTNAQIGINTQSPDSSAILEVSGDAPPGSQTTTKKGFLSPKVSLTGAEDKTTIANPATGLLVYNLVDAGIFPHEVTKDNFYYWNGGSWVKLMYTDEVVEAVKPRVFYIESDQSQIFTDAQMNSPVDITPADNLVTFTSPVLNNGNIVSFSSANSVFTINVSGVYEVSAFVNYNPMARIVIPNQPHNKRAFLNMKVQKLENGVWVNTFGSRTAWGVDGSQLKTAVLMDTPITLNAGDQIRLVIANPFDTNGTNNHCGSGDCYIGIDPDNSITVSKGFKLRLLDYNLK